MTGMLYAAAALAILWLGLPLAFGRAPGPIPLAVSVIRFCKRWFWDWPTAYASPAVALCLLLFVPASIGMLWVLDEAIRKGVNPKPLLPAAVLVLVWVWLRVTKRKKVRPLPGRKR